MLPFILLLVALAVVLGLGFVVSYNRFVAQRASIESSWSAIDVELQRRHDLIPNLVETVKGYASHERGVFEAVTEARTRAQGLRAAGADAGKQAGAENVLTQALGKLFAVAEAYPDLKADRSFLSLQAQLAETEDRVAASRRGYNSEVEEYNRRVESVPSNVVASLASFEKREYFEVDDPEGRAPVKVEF